MREISNLIVRGEAPELDKLVERIEEDIRGGVWKREKETERALRASGRGRLGLYCYSWRGESDLPAASLLLYRTDPGELASSSLVPAERRPLTVEETNGILANFEESVIRPLIEDLRIETILTSPRGNRLQWSLSPAAYGKLNQFALMVSNPANLTVDDLARWDEFWHQTHSDGSVVDDSDLRAWLKERGLTDGLTSALLSRKDVGMVITQHGMGL
jgi:hypothetical protein